MEEPIPSLTPGGQVLRVDDQTVVIRTWHRTLQIRGEAAGLAMRILDTVDGELRASEVAHRLGVDTVIVEKVLTRLHHSGVVRLSHPGGSMARNSQSHTLDLACGTGNGAGPPGPRGQGQVVVIGSGRAAELVRDHLRELNCGVTRVVASPDELSTGEPTDSLICAEELMTYRDALTVDAYAGAAGIPWCAGWWEGAQLVVTHEIRFGRSACFECLLERQRANYVQPEVDIPLEERLRAGIATTAGEHSNHAVPSLVSSLLADLLVLRTRSLLSDGVMAKRPSQLAEFDLASWELRWSTVLRLPSCSHCSPGVLRPSGVTI